MRCPRCRKDVEPSIELDSSDFSEIGAYALGRAHGICPECGGPISFEEWKRLDADWLKRLEELSY